MLLQAVALLHQGADLVPESVGVPGAEPQVPGAGWKEITRSVWLIQAVKIRSVFGSWPDLPGIVRLHLLDVCVDLLLGVAVVLHHFGDRLDLKLNVLPGFDIVLRLVVVHMPGLEISS